VFDESCRAHGTIAPAMAQDLRSYLDLLKRKRPDELVIVSKPIDPVHEITAFVVKLEREARRRPVLVFENVKGTRFPVLTNLHASRARLALAINASPEATLPTYLRAMERPIAPRVVDSGPVKDVVLKGDAVDLGALPQIIHHEGDGGVFLTAAISFAKDPTAETWNCAYNRLMLKGRDTTSIHLTLGKHLWEFQRLAESRNEPLPVAFAIGVHPAVALGALAIGSVDEDERGIMGGLLGEPLELVKCETSDVLVPAHAEMIIEAEILPHERIAEGPFGEFTGYSLGQRQREVVKVRAITHRRDAYFQDISVAHLDHMLLSTIPIEANLYRAVRAMVPSVKAVRVPAPFTCYVSIEQRIPGQAKNAILAVLGSDLYMKRVVVVDHDVDVFDDRQINWAIATRSQPDRDFVIVSHARGSDLDPSAREDGYSGKWGVDATAKPSLAAYTPRHRVPPDVLARLDLKSFLP
jgi:UbiD family decarboxylase